MEKKAEKKRREAGVRGGAFRPTQNPVCQARWLMMKKGQRITRGGKVNYQSGVMERKKKSSVGVVMDRPINQKKKTGAETRKGDLPFRGALLAKHRHRSPTLRTRLNSGGCNSGETFH